MDAAWARHGVWEVADTAPLVVCALLQVAQHRLSHHLRAYLECFGVVEVLLLLFLVHRVATLAFLTDPLKQRALYEATGPGMLPRRCQQHAPEKETTDPQTSHDIGAKMA
mmetsp:Transcript_100524/g.194097  ORF Transcript_100524/g.194097 Transcript_100524/m.194097 type:complete len:110 (+) Transcript_100524:1697-2026(+)